MNHHNVLPDTNSVHVCALINPTSGSTPMRFMTRAKHALPSQQQPAASIFMRKHSPPARSRRSCSRKPPSTFECRRPGRGRSKTSRFSST